MSLKYRLGAVFLVASAVACSLASPRTSVTKSFSGIDASDSNPDVDPFHGCATSDDCLPGYVCGRCFLCCLGGGGLCACGPPPGDVSLHSCGPMAMSDAASLPLTFIDLADCSSDEYCDAVIGRCCPKGYNCRYIVSDAGDGGPRGGGD